MAKRGNGEGGITKLKNGKFLARKAKVIAGEMVRSSKTFDKRAEAVEWLKGQSAPARGGTLGEWFDTWLELIKPDVSNKTYRDDAWRIKRHLRPRFGDVKLRDLTSETVATVLARMAAEGASDSERQKAGAVLRKCLKVAVAHKRIPASPMADLKLPTPERQESRAMLPDQAVAFSAAAEELFQMGTVFNLWCDAGLRPAEMYALQWPNFDAEKGEIKVVNATDGVTNERKGPKTKKSKRTIKLAPSTVAGLVAIRPVDATGRIMPDSQGGSFWPSNFLKWVLQPIRDRSGLDWVVPYTFRHTMATLQLRRGVPLKVVSERLGHADVMTTLKHYAHVLEGDQDRAAAVMESVLYPVANPLPVAG